MIRQISASAIICALFAISTTADAQGRPAGAGSQGGGSRPSMSQQRDRSASMRQEAELRRQQAEARRQEQEAARLAAETAQAEGPPADAEEKRALGEAHNQSADRRAMHPPAPESVAKGDNAENKTLRGGNRNTTGMAQREANANEGDGEDADPD